MEISIFETHLPLVMIEIFMLHVHVSRQIIHDFCIFFHYYHHHQNPFLIKKNVSIQHEVSLSLSVTDYIPFLSASLCLFCTFYMFPPAKYRSNIKRREKKKKNYLICSYSKKKENSKYSNNC